jgi:tetratricopeptide (TPR) repeat protein
MWPGLLVAVLLCQAAPPQVDWQAEGLKALDEKNYPAAIAALEKAVAADPKDIAARFNLALAFSLAERDEQAMDAYRATLELKPDLYEANLNLGILLLRGRRPEEAIAPLRKAVEAKPAELRPTLYLADALLDSGKHDESRGLYVAVLQRDPKSAAAELGLARASLRTGDLSQAAERFERAAQMEPAYQEALLELAEQYEKAQKPREAAAIYARFSENPAARERAGEILLAGGDAQQALPHLEYAVKNSPTSANRLALATAYLAVKDPERGIRTLSEALTADPKNRDLRLLAGRVLRDHKRYTDAAAQFLQAAAIDPNSTEIWGEVAAVSILADNYPQALAALDRVKSLGAENTSHLYLRAIILDKLKQYEPALQYYQQFLAGSQGRLPDEEFKSRQRVRIIQKELSKR